MSNQRKLFIHALLIAVFYLVNSATDLIAENVSPIATSYRVQAGQPHPDFLFPDIRSGEAVSLSQFRGKKVLLVHFASW